MNSEITAERGINVRRTGARIGATFPALAVVANALNKPVLVPSGDVTSLGSAIFAFLACGEFATVQEAQDALCPPCTTYYPKEAEAAVYDELYALFRDVYFSFGLPAAPPAKMGHILPALREIASKAIAMEIA